MRLTFVLLTVGAAASLTAQTAPVRSNVDQAPAGSCSRAKPGDRADATPGGNVLAVCIDPETRRPRPMRYQSHTYGQNDDASILTVIANAPTDQKAQVLGGDDPFSVTPSRDAVGIYAEMTNPPVYMALPVSRYTSTSVVPVAPLNEVQRARLKIGMVVDTGTAGDKYGGFITGWAADGSSISVAKWSTVGNRAAGQVPPAGGTAFVNPQTKGWVANLNSFVLPNSGGRDAVIIEGAMINHLSDSDPYDNATPQIWGYDVVNLGSKRAGRAMLVRGQSPGVHTGYFAENATFAGYLVSNTGPNFPQTGFLSGQVTGSPFAFNPGFAGTKFVVDATGSISTGNIATENGWQIPVTPALATAVIGPRGVDPVINTAYQAKGQGAQTELGGSTGLGSAPLRVTSVASPANRADIVGGSSGQSVKLFAKGRDAVVNLAVGAQGDTASVAIGAFTDLGNEVARFTSVPGQVNRLQVTGAAPGGAVTVAAAGAGPDVPLVLAAKGAAAIATASTLRPLGDATYDLGSAAMRYRSVYSSGAAIRGVAVVTSGTNFTVTGANDVIVIRKTSGSRTSIVLPASPEVGRQAVLIDGKGDASTNPITISAGPTKINGAATYTLDTNRGVARLIYDGTEWVAA
jgi:hypothetical protein